MGRTLARVTTISHVVLVSWKSGSQGAVEDSVRPVIRGFVATIPGVQSVVEGHSSSPEGLEDGFDYGFIVTFATAQARDAYLDDPVHRPVAQAIGAAAERIVVFDI
jgi:Stress responsive A/B Barrel Domain